MNENAQFLLFSSPENQPFFRYKIGIRIGKFVFSNNINYPTEPFALFESQNPQIVQGFGALKLRKNRSGIECTIKLVKLPDQPIGIMRQNFLGKQTNKRICGKPFFLLVPFWTAVTAAAESKANTWSRTCQSWQGNHRTRPRISKFLSPNNRRPTFRNYINVADQRILRP